MCQKLPDTQYSKIRATFVMEQHVGHLTYYHNLRRFIDLTPQIDATWIEVTYREATNLWEQLPGLPASVQGTLVGRSQVRHGLRQQVADVTIFNTQVPAALGGRLVRRPYILCTDITPIQYDEMGVEYGHKPDRRGLLGQYKQRLNTKLMGNAARILPWSNWTRKSLIQDYGVDARRIEVMPPGVDTEVWKPGEQRYSNRPRILFVGGDFYRKGGDVLLEAFRQLDLETAELFLVTRTPVTPGNGITVFNSMKPNSPELIKLFQSCDIFVLPTKAEAFGIAAVEASAAGLPVIGTAVGGLRDIVVEGKTGFLIEANDKDVLAARLRQLIVDVDLRLRLGQTARDRVETHFDAHKNATRVAKILQEVVAEGTEE